MRLAVARKKMASSSRKWLSEFEPSRLAACVNGKMQMLHDSVVRRANKTPVDWVTKKSCAKKRKETDAEF